jgi:hypothetical protein
MAARKSIWETMLPQTPADIVTTLAENYHLSGGQIENIARKAEVDEIISGKPATLETLSALSRDELRAMSGSDAKIGFMTD